MLHANAARAKTSIQIRLADGDRLTGRFDLTDTIADLRLFIISYVWMSDKKHFLNSYSKYFFLPSSSAKPKYAVRMFSLRTTFPNRELSDPNQSILSAGIENAVIIQSLHWKFWEYATSKLIFKKSLIGLCLIKMEPIDNNSKWFESKRLTDYESNRAGLYIISYASLSLLLVTIGVFFT